MNPIYDEYIKFLRDTSGEELPCLKEGIFWLDTSNVPDAYSILLTKPIQRRRHKKKRINKKWLKKYGYKLLVDYKDGWRIKSYKDGVYEFVKEKNYDRT